MRIRWVYYTVESKMNPKQERTTELRKQGCLARNADNTGLRCAPVLIAEAHLLGQEEVV